ncbi:MAG TPA: MFS transporter [Longimicrobiales bacterium]|nr:MFS transporter [Longimicrobiales bacterium]
MYSRRPVFAAACMGMLVFGIVLTALGSLLPSLMSRFGLANAAAGSLFPMLTLGILAGSVVFGPVVDRNGYKALLVVSVALIVVGLEGIALAPSVGFVAGSLALIGLGGGVVNGATNALVADISEEGSRSAGLSLLGVFFGVGAFGMPFLLGLLLHRFSYGAIVAGIGAAVAVPLVFTLGVRFPEPKQPQGFPLRRGVGLLRDPVLALLGFTLFFESGMEITVGGWTAAYVQASLGLAADRALFFLSLYWLGMMVARLLLGGLLRRTSPARALYASVAIALAGAAVMLTGASTTTAAIGSGLLGFGFAAVFPVVLGYVGDRYAAVSGTAFSVVIVMALIGGTALPYLTGVLGDAVGLRASFAIVPVSLCLMALVFTAARRSLAAAPAPAS